MCQRRRGNESVALGSRIGHMQSGAPSCDPGIDWQYLPLEWFQHALLQPTAQSRALLGITSFYQEHTAFEFERRDDGEI